MLALPALVSPLGEAAEAEDVEAAGAPLESWVGAEVLPVCPVS